MYKPGVLMDSHLLGLTDDECCNSLLNNLSLDQLKKIFQWVTHISLHEFENQGCLVGLYNVVSVVKRPTYIRLCYLARYMKIAEKIHVSLYLSFV